MGSFLLLPAFVLWVSSFKCATEATGRKPPLHDSIGAEINEYRRILPIGDCSRHFYLAIPIDF